MKLSLHAIRYTSIENPTLAHFRHFIRRGGFSSLFTNLPSTSVEDPLQINLFMQNKPNFRKSQMNVSIFTQQAYENISDWTLGQSKPNSNPIKPNCRKGKIDAMSVFTKDYEEKCGYGLRKNKPNSNPVLSAVEWANFKKAQNERKCLYHKGL